MAYQMSARIEGEGEMTTSETLEAHLIANPTHAIVHTGQLQHPFGISNDAGSLVVTAASLYGLAVRLTEKGKEERK